MDITKREVPPTPDERKIVKPGMEKVMIVASMFYKFSALLSFDFPCLFCF